MARHTSQGQWYTRRAGVVRGPFSNDEISRNLILGRLCSNDEVSPDRSRWTSAGHCKSLLPEELQQLSSWQDYQRLAIARVQADERKGERRHHKCPHRLRCQAERRSGKERRTASDHQLPGQRPPGIAAPHNNTRPLLLTLLLLSVIFAWLQTLQR